MTTQQYFDLVLNKIESGDFKIKKSPDLINKPDPKLNPPYLESINYFMYEYLKDRKDNRIKLLFDYIVIPNDTDPLFDFKEITFEEFFDFLIKIKEK